MKQLVVFSLFFLVSSNISDLKRRLGYSGDELNYFRTLLQAFLDGTLDDLTDPPLKESQKKDLTLLFNKLTSDPDFGFKLD